MHGRLYKRIKTQRSGKSRKLLYIPFRERNYKFLENFVKTEGFGLRMVNGEILTRNIRVR